MKWFQPPAFVYLNRENLKWIVWCTIGLWREYAQMQPIWDSTISVEQNVVIFIKNFIAVVYAEVIRFTGVLLKDIMWGRKYSATSYDSLILLSGHTQHIKAVKSPLGTFVLPQGLWNWQQCCHWSAAVSLHGPCQIRMAKGP